MKVTQSSAYSPSLCHLVILHSAFPSEPPDTLTHLLTRICLHTHFYWPRSEHWTTLRWHWQPKGHMGMWLGISSAAEPSSSSLIIVIIPPLSILSMAKSQKPFCSNGRAEEGESWTTQSNSRTELCGNIFNLYTCLKEKKQQKQRAVSVLLQIIYTQFPVHEVVKTNTLYKTAFHKSYINKGYDGQVLLRLWVCCGEGCKMWCC